MHEHCRRDYTNRHNITSYLKKRQDESVGNVSQTLRLQSEPFDFSQNCLFCGKRAELDSKHGPTVYPVRTFDCQDAVATTCLERADEWAKTVKGRLECVSDIPVADAVYHQ